MILSDKFVQEIQSLEPLDQGTFEKVVNFSISFIVKHDTQTTLAEVLEIDESDADRMFRLTLKLVSFFGKFRFGDREFKSNIEFLKLSQAKKTFFLQVMESNSQQLHKRLSFVESDGMPYFKNLEWRYDIQIASRAYEQEIKPRIFLKFDLENDQKQDHIIIESDYANLKNMREEISYLVAQLESSKQQKIKKLGQLL
ncbi:hypothetical protein pb186bvf_010824 [Paramecium bursaria]